MIAVVLLPLVLALFMFSDSLRGLQRCLFEYSIPNQLGALYDVDGDRVAARPAGSRCG